MVGGFILIDVLSGHLQDEEEEEIEYVDNVDFDESDQEMEDAPFDDASGSSGDHCSYA